METNKTEFTTKPWTAYCFYKPMAKTMWIAGSIHFLKWDKNDLSFPLASNNKWYTKKSLRAGIIVIFYEVTVFGLPM